MKKITLLLLGLLMTTSASAVENDYVPLVREGVVWEYVGYYHAWPEPGYEKVQLYTLEFNGTTTIDGLIYHTKCNTVFTNRLK